MDVYADRPTDDCLGGFAFCFDRRGRPTLRGAASVRPSSFLRRVGEGPRLVGLLALLGATQVLSASRRRHPIASYMSYVGVISNPSNWDSYRQRVTAYETGNRAIGAVSGVGSMPQAAAPLVKYLKEFLKARPGVKSMVEASWCVTSWSPNSRSLDPATSGLSASLVVRSLHPLALSLPLALPAVAYPPDVAGSTTFLRSGHWPSGWQSKVKWPNNMEYTGADLLVEQTDANARLVAKRGGPAAFGLSKARFVPMDMVNTPLPPADLLLTKDTLIHLTNEQIANFLAASVTTCPPRFKYVLFAHDELLKKWNFTSVPERAERGRDRGDRKSVV